MLDATAELLFVLSYEKPKRTWMLVRRVSMDDRPSGKRNGEGKPGGRPCPASDNLS